MLDCSVADAFKSLPRQVNHMSPIVTEQKAFKANGNGNSNREFRWDAYRFNMSMQFSKALN